MAVLSGEKECSPKCKVVATGEPGRWKEGGAADIDCKVVHRRSSSEERVTLGQKESMNPIKLDGFITHS